MSNLWQKHVRKTTRRKARTAEVDNVITIVLKIEFDCRPGAIAVSLALQESKYQETAAY